MHLTQDQKEKLVKKLYDLWKGARACPICQSTKWNISDTIFEIREFYEGVVVGGKSVGIQPVITITCETCGHTILLNAINLGFVETSHVQQNSRAEDERKE